MRSTLVSMLLTATWATAQETGAVHFKPAGDQANVPERFRLVGRTFDFELTPKRELPASGLTIHALTYPSPVTTPVPENNTVYAEYYRPKGPGPFPAAIVLDITGGDQSLSRGISLVLAQNRIAALFVQMAYYPPRRPADSRLRLLSLNFPRTIDAATQTVLDCRYAAAWLAARPEIDPKRVGILGTSLGSFIAALTGEMDERIDRVAIILGGGGLVDAYYDHPLAQPYRKPYEALGGTKQAVKTLIAPVDPLTSAANLRNRKVLMIAASRDEVVPPSAANALWQELGRPKIVWYDTTHYGAAFFIPAALTHVLAHFGAE
ncbi:MAG: prolyl oligopeptidase family serine peptidase [Gemmataceae bacterium]